ncbi:hypothetical protein E3N88_25488 [Mikania micrantha]|uniref:Uncharacterized protein n=1 Tax=Mikania micrantha TaxID=192012 RepID=A0A5N6N6I7_9ASTR|nr:hypothetical protein E3N88_25488 [Mikania micrantha]
MDFDEGCDGEESFVGEGGFEGFTGMADVVCMGVVVFTRVVVVAVVFTRVVVEYVQVWRLGYLQVKVCPICGGYTMDEKASSNGVLIGELSTSGDEVVETIDDDV